MRAKGQIRAPVVLGNWMDVPPPAGFTDWLPFKVGKRGNTYRPIGWSISQNRPTGKAYYVSTTGLETNDGLTAVTALRKIATAMAKADVDEIYLAAGTYGFTNGMGTTVLARSVSLIPMGGRVRIGAWAEGLVWTVEADPNEHVYKATRSFVGAVLERNQLDAQGDYTYLTTKASVAEVEAAAGSWYTDNVSVWVRTFDDRPVDANILPVFSSVNEVFPIRGAITVYAENIDFEGGWANACVRPLALAGPVAPTVYLNNCSLKYSNNHGLGVQGAAYIYIKDCVIASNAEDGCNNHVGQTIIPKAVEINCISRDNGAAGDIDNGSSIHDGGSIVRMNGEYARNVGRNIHDVNTGTQSWNLGVNAHDSASGVNDCNFAIGSGGADTSQMWLDGCNSSGSATDLEEDTTAVLKYRKLTSGGVFVGTPAAY